MSTPTREMVETVREVMLEDTARYIHDADPMAVEPVIVALCDAYLDAPVRELTLGERAVWGTCPVCGVERGRVCVSAGEWEIPPRYERHPARMDAAPLAVRLVPIPPGDAP